MIEFIAKAKLPNKYADFDVHVFVHKNQEHLVLIKGEFGPEDIVWTRIHSECLTGDGLFSLRCDCGPQLEFSMQEIAKHKCGMIIYLRQEGRGIGLVEKIKAYQLQDEGLDTYDANIQLGHAADNRNYDMLNGVFKNFKVKNINLMTNNPNKIKAVQKTTVNINKRVPIQIAENIHNQDYLATKRQKFNHYSRF